MADILSFPSSSHSTTCHHGGDADLADSRTARRKPKRSPLQRPAGVPDEVWSAVVAVAAAPRCAELRFREIPVSARLCDYGIGVAMERLGGGNRGAAGHGWILMLYRESAPEEWGSHWRCVAFLSAPLAGGRHDVMTPALYREMLTDALRDALPGSTAGTVSVVENTGVGVLAARLGADCEIRASWTPRAGVGASLADQLRMWGGLLLTATSRATRVVLAGA